MNRLPLALSMAILLVTAAADLEAQGSPPAAKPTRVPVVVALVDSVPGSAAPVMIVRRAEMVPHDVILLRRGVDHRQFSNVVGDLLMIRGVAGDTSRTSAMMRLESTPRSASQPRRIFPWAQRVLNDLQRARPQYIPGIGTLPAVEIWLPPQRHGQSAPKSYASEAVPN